MPPKSEIYRPDFKRIMVAVDGSENAGRAMKVAILLSRKFEAELTVVNVIETQNYLLAARFRVPPVDLLEYQQLARKAGQAIVDNAVTLSKKEGVRVRGEVLENLPSIVEGITDYAASDNVDLIVLGTRGLGGFKKLLIGSVSSGVLSHAKCAVLVVR